MYIFFMCRAGYPVSRPGKAKRESCKKKAHNDGHVPHKRKRNYPAQKVVQQMVEQVGTGGILIYRVKEIRNVRNKAEDRRSDLAWMASIAINRSAI